ncbi:DUF3800 domain-containing protein [Acidithiobacillus thiooxidans]|uniref:DUF3800 domain-containing protein n=1 Tax=Acidithiobacillus thiooxidans TaxID=930 RepID=UPI0035682CDE
MTQKIYFDESGFTGNNLLHPEQKYFSYASVATDDQEAKEFVESLISRHGIQGGELKGSKLVRFNRGRKAIDEVLKNFDKQIKLSISDKKYALACKFYEYIFEPCYSEINYIFYGIGFHRFIANILYLEFVARGAGAEEIFSEFEELMRTKDENKLQEIFSSSVHPKNSPIITQIREFAQFRSADIREELSSLGDVGVGKWILDLTNTALFTLLANWGTKYDKITAVCDPSKPLQHDQSLFTSMINRTDRIFSDAFGEHHPHPITFNLSGPIAFEDSKITHGIQLADVAAAAAVYAFSGATDEHAMQWRELIPEIGHYGSIIPDMDEVNLKGRRVQRNAVLLMELHSRAKFGKSLLEGMPEYIELISRLLITHPISA